MKNTRVARRSAKKYKPLGNRVLLHGLPCQDEENLPLYGCATNTALRLAQGGTAAAVTTLPLRRIDASTYLRYVSHRSTAVARNLWSRILGTFVNGFDSGCNASSLFSADYYYIIIASYRIGCPDISVFISAIIYISANSVSIADKLSDNDYRRWLTTDKLPHVCQGEAGTAPSLATHPTPNPSRTIDHVRSTRQHDSTTHAQLVCFGYLSACSHT